MYGDTNKRRVDFVKERLIDIQWNRKPDNDVFLDENGRKKPVAPPQPENVHTASKGLSQQWGDEASSPPPSWAVEATKEYPYERRPAWLAQPYSSVSQSGEQDGGTCTMSGAAATAAAEEDEAEMDDASQEQARLEWLQYYLQTGAWSKAGELVVTPDEREDLEYLIDRERRLGPESASACSGARGESSSSEMNDAAHATVASESQRPGHSSAPVAEDDDML